ncbi:Cytochrome c553 [Nitrosomonas cryotolerans]|uniref:Cytochrome c553 n=1 Tax=Nitrosomonas cryotolerans ATCC 49181 TaxID=1131553 RepID=A0A1N6H3Y3_9PROT|nr:c-type cytochrome [Nitrosomonas cryotolerans]SFP72187.1 Cytochrome c553 [Nitrosomonas cryotolerans]SIO14511.1 Cytochrome c553 [Nitrosomonas cryotolerans ATCC 49181]
MKQKAIMNLLLATSMFMVFSGLAQAAGDAAAVKDKVSMCIGCHEIEGYRTAYPVLYHVPKIGGQHEAYLLKALGDYKSGARNHPSMSAIAATLSEQDLEDFAAYYAGK